MRKRRYVSLLEQQSPPLLTTMPSCHNFENNDDPATPSSSAAMKRSRAQPQPNHHNEAIGNDLVMMTPVCSPETAAAEEEEAEVFPVPQCHNIVSTSQIQSSQRQLNLQRLADLFPFTTYDRKRFAAITVRLANPHCTCLLFGSGKLVITGSTSFNACIVASHEITRILRQASPRDTFEVLSCQIQNLVAHVSLAKGLQINLDHLYERFNEQSTYQRSVFPGLVLRPPRSPIVLLIFTSGRIVCTGGRSYHDIYYGFRAIFDTLRPYLTVAAA